MVGKATLAKFLTLAGTLAFTCAILGVSADALDPQAASPNGIVRRVGSIKAINGNSLAITPDSGAEFHVTVPGSAKLLRIAPGEKNLQNASPFQMQDLQVGDRVLVSGTASADGNTIAAVSLILMKRADLDATHQQERQDWQKRGIGGVVNSVDASTGTFTVAVSGLGGAKSVVVHTSKDTIIRRYPPDSVKFEDAKPSTLQDIQAGNQLWARGDRSADGAELTAQEIVSGSYRNIPGTVISVDASTNILSVQDLLSKKAVQVKIGNNTVLRKLPPEVAQRIAFRIKGGAAAAAGNANPSGNAAGDTAQSPGNTPPPGGGRNGQAWQGGGVAGPGGPGGGMRGGAADIQQFLSRMPVVTLADLKKGDALMIVASQEAASNDWTATTLVAGVEPILQAAPSASQAVMLAPWSLSAPAGGEGVSQ